MTWDMAGCPTGSPLKCACGQPFTVEHALSCPSGSFPTIRDDELRDIMATLLAEISSDRCIEPELHSIAAMSPQYATTSTNDNARLDIQIKGLWGSNHQSAFLNLKVFNPNSPTYKGSQPSSCYVLHERTKERAYKLR